MNRCQQTIGHIVQVSQSCAIYAEHKTSFFKEVFSRSSWFLLCALSVQSCTATLSGRAKKKSICKHWKSVAGCTNT